MTKPKEDNLKQDATRTGNGTQNRAGKSNQGVTQAKQTTTKDGRGAQTQNLGRKSEIKVRLKRRIKAGKRKTRRYKAVRAVIGRVKAGKHETRRYKAVRAVKGRVKAGKRKTGSYKDIRTVKRRFKARKHKTKCYMDTTAVKRSIKAGKHKPGRYMDQKNAE